MSHAKEQLCESCEDSVPGFVHRVREHILRLCPKQTQQIHILMHYSRPNTNSMCLSCKHLFGAIWIFIHY